MSITLDINLDLNPVLLYAEEEFPNNDSITRLAEASGITYQTVHKTVRGLYSTIPVKLVTYMTMNSDYTTDEWNKLYSLWIKRQMVVLKGMIELGRFEAVALITAPAKLSSFYADFTAWRESLSSSQMDFCKTFMMHQAIISKYEAGQMYRLPESLVERLKFLGVSVEYINALEKLPTRKKK